MLSKTCCSSARGRMHPLSHLPSSQADCPFRQSPIALLPISPFPISLSRFISIYIFYIQKTAPEYKYVFLLFCTSFIYIRCIISIYLEYNSTSTERLFMFLVCIDGKVLLCDKKNACKLLEVKTSSFNQSLFRNKGHFEMTFKRGYARPIGCIDITGTDLDKKFQDEMI